MLQEMVQEIENTARNVVDEIHTALPGKIVSFNSGKCTAVVKPVCKYQTAGGEQIEYPAISDVPVVFPMCQSKGIGLAYPVKSGDSCLIICCETEVDEWRSGAESEGALRFDLTNAVVIPGLLKTGNDLVTKACNENAVVIKNGSTKLTVTGSQVEVEGKLRVKGSIYYTGEIIRG